MIRDSISQFFNPTVIAVFVALFSVLLSFRTHKLQRIESERQEIYKNLNNFYGPMRLNLNRSNELYKQKGLIVKVNRPCAVIMVLGNYCQNDKRVQPVMVD